MQLTTTLPDRPDTAGTLLRRLQHAARWLRLAAIPGIPAFGGAAAFNLQVIDPAMPWHVAQGFILAAALFAFTLRLVKSRTEGFAALFAWYLGALAALAPTWSAFFGNAWGWPVWVVACAILAVPAFLAPKRHPAIGVVAAIVLAAFPPLGLIGMCTPLLAAGAIFPGAGWSGLVLTLIFFALSQFKGRAPVLGQIVILGVGMTGLGLQPIPAPADAWAATTHHSPYPDSDWRRAFALQDEAQQTVKLNVGQGAGLVLLPESTNPLWDDGQAFYWKGVRQMAMERHAQVLIGVYTNPMLDERRTNGLLDLTSGKLYPARIAMPIAMWRPWTNDGFPLHLGATDPIPTHDGPAAYLICYEELLVWPLASQMVHHTPRILLSAANQWFAKGWLARPQQRSVAMQARLWGLPLIRAANLPAH